MKIANSMITCYKNGTVGLHAVDSTGREISYNADESFPLASTVKLPIDVEAYMQIHSGVLKRYARIRLTQGRKSPGSGVLGSFQGNYNFRVDDLTYEMMAHSDNTATDMVLEAVGAHNVTGVELDGIDRVLTGIDNVRKLTKPYGMDIVMGMRSWFLFASGYSSEFRRRGADEIARLWKKKSYREKRRSVEMVLRENDHVDRNDFLNSYQDADDRGTGYLLENYATPRNMTRFTADIHNGMFGIKVRDDVLRTTEGANGYIKLCLPDNVVVYSKAGCIDGAVADSGIITIYGVPEWHMVMSIFIKDAKETNMAGVDMSKMAKWCYEEMCKQN